MIKDIKISVHNLRKSFGSKQVLQGVDLDIASGESLVVIGGSGTGKSVLIKTIIGLIKEDSGTIKIDGEDVTKMTGKEREGLMKKFGMLFQGGALFDSLKVWENISFYPMNVEKMPAKQAKELAVEKLGEVGLKPEIAFLSPSELSGGMQKRVSLARAIAASPEIIFFDEPTTGLDPIMADVINNLIIKCSEKLGATTFTITHDMASVRKIADRVAMIYGGRIIWVGTVEEMDKTENEFVQQFIHGRAEGPIQMEIRKS